MSRRAIIQSLVTVAVFSTCAVALAAQQREYPSFPDAVTEPPLWNDANPPFDLFRFLEAPAPEENAAPLYLDALFEFESRMGYGFVPKGVRERQYQGDVLKRSLAAQARLKELHRFNQAWEKDREAVDIVAVEAWLPGYDIGFQKLEAAQKRHKCVFLTALSYGERQPHATASYWVVARVIPWRTRRDLRRGDLERPIQDLKALLRLSRDLGPRGVMLCQNVAIAMEEIACQQLVLPILAAPAIRAEDCDRLLALLVEHEAGTVDAYSEALRAVYFVARSVMHDFQYQPDSSQIQRVMRFLDAAGDSGQEYRRRIQAMTKDDYAQEVDTLNRHVEAFLTLEEQPGIQRLAKLEKLSDLIRSDKRDSPLLQLLMPDLKPFRYTFLRMKPTLRATQCLVALRRWQFRNAIVNDDLEKIVKVAGLPGVPIDPWSDRPLLMAMVEGKPAVYSVGPDGRDDGAQSECKGPLQSGDYVFRLLVP